MSPADPRPDDDRIITPQGTVTTMQPIAAYYVYLANERAREASARHQYRSIPPKRTARRRFGAALGAIVRPLRGSASAA